MLARCDTLLMIGAAARHAVCRSDGVVRDHVLRVAAVGLVLYGILGFVLIGLGYQIASRTFREIDAIGVSIAQQRDALVGSLRATSATLATAGASFDGFDKTLGEAQGTSRQAADFARGLSQTMADMSGAAQVQIFGIQPLGQLGQGFTQASGQLLALGDDLERTSQSLGQNAGGLKQVQGNLAQVRVQVDGLARAFETTPLLGAQAVDLTPFKLAIYGLLVWLAGQALVSILLGVALFDRAHARLRAYRAARPRETVVVEEPAEEPAERAESHGRGMPRAG